MRTGRWIFVLCTVVAAYLAAHLVHAVVWGAWS